MLIDRACSRSRDDRCLSFLLSASDIFSTAAVAPLQLDAALADLKDLMNNGQRQAGRTSFVNANEMGGIAQTAGDKAFTRLASDLAANLSKYFR